MEDELKKQIFSVSQISGMIKDMLEGVLSDVQIEGEISGLKKAASGHIYFDIKDEGALISAVLFKGYAVRAPALKDGLKIHVRGDITSFAKQSKYQIIVKAVAAKSEGDLFLEFERLKAKLSAEGLFDQDRKRELPRFPKIIGVVTSPAGAAFRDIISVLKRRAPNTEVVIAPALVQGTEAAEQIADAIEKLNKLSPRPDVALIGRGGGSMEDLWCFNDERVARAIAASKIPTVSCVGHETDFTIADFVADLRAATPSAAAELVAENNAETFARVYHLSKQMINTVNLLTARAEGRLNTAMSNKFLKDPLYYLEQKQQEVDAADESIKRAFEDKQKYALHSLNLLTHKLNALSPMATLKRGFAIVRNQGVLVRGPEDAMEGDVLDIQTSKGRISAKAE
ncbi:exodeoxyribonuclease VII large subunit [Parelusimicrobium proximum]|uniref:exodeoxyribonuclease VII large subunit n=1 Tax=Parelusimicrobium proximum TaxID=3228953 RepID=UPI003D172CE6